MLATATAAVFLAVALAVYGTLDLVFAQDRRVSRRLRGLTRYEHEQAKIAEPMLRPFSERMLRPFLDGLSGVFRALWPTRYRDLLVRRVERAGLSRGAGIGRLALAKGLALLGGSGAAFVLALAGGWRLGPTVFAVVVAGSLSFFAPDLWLAAKIAGRQHDVALALPDMLDMLTISVEAGLGFDSALSKVVRGSHGPLALEFGRVLQEVQAGASRKTALRAMAERCDVPELSAFIAHVVQAEVFGVSVSKVLRTQAAEMRLRRRQRAEEAAQKAPVKMVVPLVFCILPATIIVVAGPAIMRIAGLFD